jgi:hypothetical protein
LIFSLIIDELRVKPSLLVWVLDDAFNMRPYDSSAVGNIPKMTDAWIEWADEHAN